MFKLLLFLLFILPSITAESYEGSLEYDDDPRSQLESNCSKAAGDMIISVVYCYHYNLTVTQKMASKTTESCYQLQECLEQGVMKYKKKETYFKELGKNIDALKMLQNGCTVLDSLSGPLGECFEKIRGYNKTELMANSWASMNPNQKKNFEKDRDGNITESCISIMNPYSQSLIDKDCTPEAVEEFGKVSKSMKYVSCMLIGFFSVPDFYRYIDSI